MTLRDPRDIEAELRELFERIVAVGREYIDVLEAAGRSRDEAARDLLAFNAHLQGEMLL